MPILFYKKRSETPLQALDRLRLEKPELSKERLSYAGRLDPMADGLLAVLVGDENFEREKFLKLDKEYEVEILWGVTTDTYDVLGVVGEVNLMRLAEQQIERELGRMCGKFLQNYPPFSSKTVNGKALHEYAREGKLSEIEIPQNECEIYEIEIIGHRNANSQVLLSQIEFDIQNVVGDFRQEEILKRWREVLATPNTLNLTKIRAKVSSGTYMRSLAFEIGKKIGCGAIAFSITRTKILFD